MTPCYFALDCIPTPEGSIRVVDLHGGVGSGLRPLTAAYGGVAPARARLRPYLERLGEVAEGRRILFLHDAFAARQPFPDDFFELVQRCAEYGPITDWVPDVGAAPTNGNSSQAPEVEEMGVFLDPLAGRLRLRIGYGSSARVDHDETGPRVLLSGYRQRARARATTVILPPEELGAVVYSGRSDRFPPALAAQAAFPVVNPPLLDRLLENRWLAPELLRETPVERLLARWVPVGMGLRTGAEVVAFSDELREVNGHPLAVLKPSFRALAPGLRFLDRTALRALAARQPRKRLPGEIAADLLQPRVAHSYEEVARYPGKLLDTLLRTPGAHVDDHGDGTFHFSAPYPFMECTVSVLQEYVEGAPVRSRRTGKFHQASLRVVMFDRKIVGAIYRFAQEPDDGTFPGPRRRDMPVFYEAASSAEEEALEARLSPLVREIEEQFAARIRTDGDLEELRDGWVQRQTAP